MPAWETYEVVAETIVTIKCGNRVISSFKTFGVAKGESAPVADNLNMNDAVNAATTIARSNADLMARAARQARDLELRGGH